jgi:hypothetical protein
MRAPYVATATAMTVRELARKRVVLVLALCVPAVFFAVAFATESNQVVSVVLAAAGDRIRSVEQLDQSLLFIGMAAAGLISAFFASSLIQRQLEANRRLVLCGFRASELIAARVAVLLAIIAATALYTWAGLALFTRLEFVSPPRFPAGVLTGLAVGAFVHGGYGLLVGTIFRRELESIFAILALINIDAGWLQNPIYYRTAGAKWLIQALPGYSPSQITYLSAFTTEPIGALVVHALAYGATLLLAALALYAVRMRVTR